MNLRTREQFAGIIFNLSRTPKLMQRHYKYSKVEKNEMNGIIFLKNNLSLVDSGKNIGKQGWWIRETVSPNQRFWERNNYLWGLNEGNGLFSKLILVKRRREAYQKRGIIWCFTIFVIDSSFRFSSQKISSLVR